jgi:hypothetical protein
VQGKEKGEEGEMESTILRCLLVHWKDARKASEPSMAQSLGFGEEYSAVMLYLSAGACLLELN